MSKMFSSLQARVGFKYKISIQSVSPMVVVIDNFLTEVDIEKLMGKLGPDQWQVFPKAEAEKTLFSGEVAVCRDECRQVSSYIEQALHSIFNIILCILDLH